MDTDTIQRQLADLMAFRKQAQPIIDQTIQFLRSLPQHNERICGIESALANLQSHNARIDAIETSGRVRN